MKKTTLFITMFLPFFVISQQITSILPSQGNQGQTINLIISGNNMSFSGFSCWSNTGNLSEFRFSQWSNTNMFYGIANSSTTQTLSGTTNINPTQTPGIYNLEVLDCASSQWIMLPTSFEVTPGVTWECSGTGNCYDPGNGLGAYASLSACQSNCIIPQTWVCNGAGTCYDPGNGTGTYTSLLGPSKSLILCIFNFQGKLNFSLHSGLMGGGRGSTLIDSNFIAILRNNFCQTLAKLKLIKN